MHVIAAKAVCFKEALEPGFKTYQKHRIAWPFDTRGNDMAALLFRGLIYQGV